MTYSLMTVCTGNICRSPMAETVLKQAFEEAGLGDAVTIRSTAVTSEEVGNPIDERAARVLAEAGYTVPDRQAVRIRPADVDTTDLVLPMTRQHARELRRLGFPDEKVVLYRTFESGVPEGTPEELAGGALAASSASALDVTDPWYGTDADFVECLEAIEAAAPGIVEYVRGQLDAE